MKKYICLVVLLILTSIGINFGCQHSRYSSFTVIQSSKSGDKLSIKKNGVLSPQKNTTTHNIILRPENTYQTIVGFGGAFTESSAYVLTQLSDAKRAEVLDKYFSESGAAYSLMRTHINSCDFSLSNYSYAPVPNDTDLSHFSIDEDADDLLPLIKDAMAVPGANFKLIASPWTAPPWMKDNNDWNGGTLKKEYYPTWALFFSKYIHAYAENGVPIWGVTVENEPLGNGGQWESMIYSPETMADFIKNYLGPQFENDELDVKILSYDQNRDELMAWTQPILSDPDVAKYVWGTAVHWYSSTIDWCPDALNEVHEKYPDKHLLHTEGCIDNVGDDEPAGIWMTDDWYWRREATDWGYYWAAEADKKNHPKYVPVYRYARDIIGGLNSWLTGWIDWNIVLDTKGGPNHAENWCVAPVLVDAASDSVYYTPLYYTMCHFSKYIQPGAQRIGVETDLGELMVAACKNPDKNITVEILNQHEKPVAFHLIIEGRIKEFSIPENALQTILLH